MCCCLFVCVYVYCSLNCYDVLYVCVLFFFQAEDGIRDLVRSRGLGDVYKRQKRIVASPVVFAVILAGVNKAKSGREHEYCQGFNFCLLYTSDAADERSSVDLGGRRIIKKKT